MEKKEIRIRNAFDHGKVLIGFVTGGDPSMEKSLEFIIKMVEAGCGLIEIGIPFSDPVAEGPVIQEANGRALEAGATTERIFELAAAVREETKTPLVLRTYLNPVFRYGYHAFCKKCKETGVNGILVPDMPYEEKEELAAAAKTYGVALLSLAAPASRQRIRMIAAEAAGFIYVEPLRDSIGTEVQLRTELCGILSEIRAVTDVPAVIAFETDDSAQLTEAARLADGVIIGSSIAKLIAQYREKAGGYLYDYVKKMKEAMQETERNTP